MKYNLTEIITIVVFQFLLTWLHTRIYMLCVLDNKYETVTVVDSKPVPKWCQDMVYKNHVRQIMQWSPRYMKAMNVHNPNWNQDIFMWPYTRKDDIEIDKIG